MELGSGTLMEIRKEAAAWLIEMDIEPEHWDRSAFLAWLKYSPRHMEEFLYQSALWMELHKVIGMTTTDVRKLLNDSRNVVELPRAAESRAHNSREMKYHSWFTRLAACMVIVAAASAGVWHLLSDNTRVLTTAIGEQRAVRLADRSVVHLNTDTRVEIRFTDTSREVRLIQGEALFTVERDVNRPFRVYADDIKVEALGTQFNVRRRASDTIVSVVEGRVAVVGPSDFPTFNRAEANKQNGPSAEQDQRKQAKASRTPSGETYEAGRPAPANALAVVTAGEQVRVSVDGAIKDETGENATENATAWRQRQLVFTNTPLIDVATEVARYNLTPQLQIEGETLQARQLSGVFAADDPESLIQFLEHEGLSITRHGDTVVIDSP